MNAKQYHELMKHLRKERDAEEKKRTLNAFKDVQMGESVSVKDLDIVREYMCRKTVSQSQLVDMKHMTLELERDVNASQKDIKKSKEILKRHRLNLDRLRRSRRIQQNEKHQEQVLDNGV